jgi:hypothetical protein
LKNTLNRQERQAPRMPFILAFLAVQEKIFGISYVIIRQQRCGTTYLTECRLAVLQGLEG